MINKENILRCKLALYRELLNAEETSELTSVELDMGMLLVFDRQVQDHIEENGFSKKVQDHINENAFSKKGRKIPET